MEKYIDEFVIRFKPVYALNDPAHRLGHFIGVYKQASMINLWLGVPYEEEALLAVALFHDLFSWSRVNHHDMSREWVMSSDDPLLQKLLEASVGPNRFHNAWEARIAVSFACGEHRASYKGGYSSLLSEIMASADRGALSGKEPIIKRAFKYARAHNPDKGFDFWVEQTLTHMKEKFSSKGYARYPKLYEDFYSSELNTVRQEMDLLLKWEVAEICSVI